MEDITRKCREIERRNRFIKDLTRRAGDPQWVDADPGYTMLKAIAKSHADKLVALAQELRALIPN